MHELHSNLLASLGAPPAITSDNTAVVCAIVDMQGHKALEWYIATGTLADSDATFAVAVDHGDQANLSDAAAAPSECLVGTLAAAGFRYDDDSTIKKIGVVPGRGAGKRYWRLTITPSNNSGAAPLAVLALRLPLGRPVA
ncbi:MAG: hypothetical protein AB7I59_05425 [Geminicoccaceae bacterium]